MPDNRFPFRISGPGGPEMVVESGMFEDWGGRNPLPAVVTKVYVLRTCAGCGEQYELQGVFSTRAGAEAHASALGWLPAHIQRGNVSIDEVTLDEAYGGDRA